MTRIKKIINCKLNSYRDKASLRPHTKPREIVCLDVPSNSQNIDAMYDYQY